MFSWTNGAPWGNGSPSLVWRNSTGLQQPPVQFSSVQQKHSRIYQQLNQEAEKTPKERCRSISSGLHREPLLSSSFLCWQEVTSGGDKGRNGVRERGEVEAVWDTLFATPSSKLEACYCWRSANIIDVLWPYSTTQIVAKVSCRGSRKPPASSLKLLTSNNNMTSLRRAGTVMWTVLTFMSWISSIQT